MPNTVVIKAKLLAAARFPVEGKIVFIKEEKRLSLVITGDKFHSVDEVLAAPDERVFSSIEAH